MSLIRQIDDSVETPDGRVVLFSVPRFLAEIADGDGCFICGAKPGTKAFNEEHVVPDWVLRDRGLHSGNIVLPNSASFMYGRYVVPCCKDCNETMAEMFEVPISIAFARGYEGVVDLMRSGRGSLLWHWLALIFLKVHLKHRELRWHLDRRLGDAMMSEAYDWTQLHHIHCVARSFFSGAVIDPRVYGSLFVWPASDAEDTEEFDFADLLPGASLVLRIGAVFAFAVFNDSGFAVGSLKETIQKITGPLTLIQGRELLAKLCHRNLSLEPRPQYHSSINLWTGEYTIAADIPEDIHLIEDPRPDLYGQIMAFFVREILEGTGTDPQILEYVREGHYTFLFGGDGKFLAH
jgi:hypothetical protein